MNKHLLLGVPHIDHQHNELLRSFQHLLEVYPGEESISEALSRLTNQIHKHFEAEEIFMVGLGMPAEDFREHEQAHSQIIEGLTEIHLEAMRGLRTPFEEIVNRVSGYVNRHIIEYDLGLKAYILQRG